MKIYGAIGRIGSGKDEVVKYLNIKYGIPTISVGDIVREIAAEHGLSTSREELNCISFRCIKEHSKEYFMGLVLDRVRENGWNEAGVTGVRTPDDVRYLKKHLGDDFILFNVYIGDPGKRYNRLSQRMTARDPRTYDEFLEQDQEEESMFHIDEALSMADYSLDNSGTIEHLHGQIDEVIKKNRIGLVPIRSGGESDD